VKIRKIIIIIVFIVVAIAAFIAAGYSLPRTLHIERVAFIQIAPESVYNILNNPGQYEKWMHWAGVDPDIQFQGDGRSGQGASVLWQSAGNRVAAGKATVVDAQPYQVVRILLEHGKSPPALTSYILAPLEGYTHLRWTFDRDLGANIISRYSGFLAKSRIDKEFERNLRKLKSLAENLPPLPQRNIVEENLRIKIGDVEHSAYLVFDGNIKKAPAVLVLHDAQGYDGFVKSRARMLSELGYVAMAVDLYGDGNRLDARDDTERPYQELNETPGSLDPLFSEVFAILKNHPAVDSSKLAAVGYGQGGNLVFDMARKGVALKGAVSFYPDLTLFDMGDSADNIKTSFLIFDSGDDHQFSQQNKVLFYKEMDAMGIDYEIVAYQGMLPDVSNFGMDDPLDKNESSGIREARQDDYALMKLHAFLIRVFG
jgi:dienelactone hydrolase/uncharacterized protein YndB with AHSA1/START domain